MPRAYALGPVYGQLWHEYSDSVSSHFSYAEGEGYSSPFTSDEDEVIDTVCRNFGCYSGTVLSRITHNKLPWRAAHSRLESNREGELNDVIREEDMDSFFRGVVERYSISKPDGIALYARNAFRKVVGRLF